MKREIYIALDTETTHLANYKLRDARKETSRVFQISLSIFDDEGMNIFDTTSLLQLPEGVEISKESQEVTGFSTETCNKNGVPREAIFRIIKFYLNKFKDCDITFIAHNAKFDKWMMESEFHKFDPSIDFASYPWICTMELTRDIVQIPPTEAMLKWNITGYKSPSLKESYEFIMEKKFDTEKAHDAGYDIEMTKELFLKIIKDQIV